MDRSMSSVGIPCGEYSKGNCSHPPGSGEDMEEAWAHRLFIVVAPVTQGSPHKSHFLRVLPSPVNVSKQPYGIFTYSLFTFHFTVSSIIIGCNFYPWFFAKIRFHELHTPNFWFNSVRKGVKIFQVQALSQTICRHTNKHTDNVFFNPLGLIWMV